METSSSFMINDPLFASRYVPRLRVDNILHKAVRSKLVYVIAGAGYGKTQAVRHYIEQQEDAVVRWVQLTDGDNVGSRYWDSLTHGIAIDNPELAVKLRDLGFPDTTIRFKQFAEILKSTEHRSNRTFLVLDDFHLIHSEQALNFAERCAYLQIPGACVIIISRSEPEINAVSLFSKGQVIIVTEDELRFTESEISDLLTQRGVQFSAKDLPLVADATKGWALAVELFSVVLKRMPANLERALDTMKQNIFKLMEVEAFIDFSPETQKLLVKLSLVSNLPSSLLQDLFHRTTFLQEAPQLISFIWVDSFSGVDRVHPLYWEFLQSKRDILSNEEIKSAYREAAQWCSGNRFCLDTMYYLAKAQDYDRMVELLFSYPFKLPHDVCAYYVDIIDNLEPGEDNLENSYITMLKNFFVPLLLSGMRRFEEAERRSFDIISKWEGHDTPEALQALYTAYSNLVYIDMYRCTVTHKYNAPVYLRQAIEYHKRVSLPQKEAEGAFFVADVRSLACLVGENASIDEFDQFVEAVKQTTLYISQTNHSMYYGYDDLVLCELSFYKNQPDTAKTHARQAMLKAREKKQYSIEMMAAQYLLRISLQEGDYPLAAEVLKKLSAYLEIDEFWNRQLLYDLFIGFFYIQTGLPDLVPSWLSMDEIDTTSYVRIQTKELIVSVKRHIASKNYNQALTVLCNSFPREPQERFLLSELELTLLTAIAHINTGDTQSALQDFEKAYTLSLKGVFEMPFIELGKNLQPVINASAQNNSIPSEWLAVISRKASIYAKKASAVSNSFKRKMKIPDGVQMSDREREVINDLYHGLSREEIAENRYLSINTVKKILQSIYIKLDANNNVDAIRIALEKKIINQ